MNWQTITWKVTKKLVYYVLIVCGIVFLVHTAFDLANAKDTLENLAGYVLGAVAIGVTVGVAAREIQLFCGNNNEQTNNENTDNE